MFFDGVIIVDFSFEEQILVLTVIEGIVVNLIVGNFPEFREFFEVDFVLRDGVNVFWCDSDDFEFFFVGNGFVEFSENEIFESGS